MKHFNVCGHPLKEFLWEFPQELLMQLPKEFLKELIGIKIFDIKSRKNWRKIPIETPLKIFLKNLCRKKIGEINSCYLDTFKTNNKLWNNSWKKGIWRILPSGNLNYCNSSSTSNRNATTSVDFCDAIKRNPLILSQLVDGYFTTKQQYFRNRIMYSCIPGFQSHWNTAPSTQFFLCII